MYHLFDIHPLQRTGIFASLKISTYRASYYSLSSIVIQLRKEKFSLLNSTNKKNPWVFLQTEALNTTQVELSTQHNAQTDR